CAILLIRVDEVPRPQFLGKSNSATTSYPLSPLKNVGFSFLAPVRILYSLCKMGSGLLKWPVSTFDENRWMSNMWSNQILPFSSRLFQISFGRSISFTARDCP